ncbi:IS3 family transposase [Prolixibacter denitrificans]|uniref:IS3 family transposase n=1 Tax=Prolixibacter denitrificans TaxID=1541063 RepID=UPI00280A77B6|nr:IS3 family transposase [Prolixibacter denitrificans]
MCRLFGFTRQAHHKHYKKQERAIVENHIIVQMVNEIRKEHPRMGTRKLYHLLKPDLEMLGIKMGRDALFDLLSTERMLIRKRRRQHITTNSHHWYRKYPNLIQGFIPSGPNQLWVSDITYLKTHSGFRYLFLLTDAYSKKILGYHLAIDLDSTHAVACLQRALKSLGQPVAGLIHHSDRGIQYCSKEYVNLLQDYQIQVSMTENSNPRDNAIAERVNGILKDEYLHLEVSKNIIFTNSQLEKTINKYNNRRPHLSCNMLTPEQAHLRSGTLKKRWKTYYKKQVNLNV